MPQSLNLLISEIALSSNPCKRLLEFDGITSNRLVMRDQRGKLLLSCKNVPALKEKIKDIGTSITIIKNLDEYQYLICKYVPHLSDQNVFKFKFQKIRLLIFLFIKKFANVLLETESKASILLDELNKSGKGILLETSELIQIFREASSTENLNIDTSKNIENQITLKTDHFISFNHRENEINNVLFSIYGFTYDEKKKVENEYDRYNDNDDDDDLNRNYVNY
ncbi:MAG TPA: hypothetical protein VD815_02350 [Candidatus Saccharimonadales bacterium]|nr:hypothetical protein [Candidatus Saccharimonadales bacterium]